MSKNTTRRLLALAGLGGLVAGAAIYGASPSSATTMDDLFIAALNKEGVPYNNNPAGAVDLAHTVCHALDMGVGLGTVMLTIVQAGDGYWTVEQAGSFVGASIGAYCIEHAPAGTEVA
ncbi:hypothetical protein SEA_EPONINE_56 [Mycobacterium phage Eponine]|uniref:DUF732 domain-containing protein n=1 Tax=Mycobacterium phage Eponine TaxID=2708631 RepID=A0A6G6XSS7_9CAUD|nr:hypothetical protein I5G69_gp81 [Mycobacterium phage Eponine]QIG61829.1 hypothetical protein SEA_EPONINE_56 [Mycobacterium phage Eponine]